MKNRPQSHLYKCMALVLLAGAAGCAATPPPRVVEPGDRVGIHFTCRRPNGEIAASTYKDINDSLLPKSTVFTKRNRGDAVVIEAGSEKHNPSSAERKSFEDEILNRLSGMVVGMKQGESATLNVVAERIAGPTPEKFTKIARIRKRPKEMKMSLEEYKGRTGKEPAVGQPFTIDPAVPGKVIEVSNKTVVIRFSPPATEVYLPFGKGIIKEKEDRYEIDIQAVKGTLVRTGGMVGRIVDVDADSITIDYGHPFGGEALKCDVKVESVQPGEKKKAAGGVTADKEIEKTLDAALLKAAADRNKVRTTAATTDTVQLGDLVTVNYTASLEDGAIFSTTLENVAKRPENKKVSWFREPDSFAAEEIVAGRQELVPGLVEAVVGMKVGEKKRISLAPEQAFGPRDPQKQVQLPCARSFPRVIRMPAEEYVKRFSSFPVLNKEIDLVPHFKAKVAEVTERDVALEFLVKSGDTFSDSYGTVTVSVAGDRITTTLKPVIGAQFPVKDGMGVIIASDGSSFTVDGNHPLAGKNIVIDLEIVSLTKTSSMQPKPIDWIEDHDLGLARAKKEGKPVVLVLYADWCGWCKKIFSESVEDPRVKNLRDRFVWAKVNSDKEKKYKQQYGQDGYPMLVLLKPDGTVAEKIEGFRDGAALSKVLKDFLESS